jgi:hypothetical protein
MGVNGDGGCHELIDLKVLESEYEGFCGECIGPLKDCGLTGDKLLISNPHSGLINAIRRMLQVSGGQHSGDPLSGVTQAVPLRRLRSVGLQLPAGRGKWPSGDRDGECELSAARR